MRARIDYRVFKLRGDPLYDTADFCDTPAPPPCSGPGNLRADYVLPRKTMQIAGAGGETVRIGVDSWVTGSPGAITVDDTPLRAPYTVTAIGDGPTLAAALNIPGGVVDAVARAGGSLTVEQFPQVDVPALREIKPRQYSQPG